MGSVEVAPDTFVGVDCPDGPLEVLLLFLLSRKAPKIEVLALEATAKESGASFPWDVNARERVRGRKYPSLPRGMLSPWTT